MTAQTVNAGDLKLADEPRQHRFFDFKNSSLIAVSAVALSLDSISTRRGLGIPGTRELNPLARPFVSSTGGEVAYSLGSMGAEIGSMYICHRMERRQQNHGRMWRWAEKAIPVAFTAVEANYARKNYQFITNAPGSLKRSHSF